MWWRHTLAVSGGGSLYGCERFASMMWPEVPANAWLAMFLVCGLVSVLILYRKQIRRAVAYCFRNREWARVAAETRLNWDPGRGDLAAAAIKTAATFQAAAATFNDWRWSPQPRVPEQAFVAMEERLRTEGETEETVRFLDEHGAWQTSLEYLPPVPMNDPHRYEFALMLLLRQAHGEDDR